VGMFLVKGKEGNGNSRQAWRGGGKGLMNETETEWCVPAPAY